MTTSLPGGAELVLDSHRERASGARHRSGHVRDTRRVLQWRDPDSNRGHHDLQSCFATPEVCRLFAAATADGGILLPFRASDQSRDLRNRRSEVRRGVGAVPDRTLLRRRASRACVLCASTSTSTGPTTRELATELSVASANFPFVAVDSAGVSQLAANLRAGPGLAAHEPPAR